MITPVKLSETTDPGQAFESVIAIDETGIHEDRIPTVVSASFIDREQSVQIVKKLLNVGAEPWIQKSTDLDISDIYRFFKQTEIPSRARAAWGSPNRGQRALMAVEAVKEVVPAGVSHDGDTTNCLVILDGRVSNFGGKQNILRSRSEILDDYFEDQNNVNIAFATLEKGDRTYPEVTVADCACNVFRHRIEQGNAVEQLEKVQRFDSSRSVPSVDFEDRIYQLAPKGVAQKNTFESKVAAWLTGHRPSEDALGELSQQQFETLVENRIDDEDISQYVIDTRNRLGSQQV
ncbi:hypothetical protein HZS55_07150 [Halosimplex rubrum]|uniref:DUF3800 domain-containing protein n=1 Tax=Halosimplex rubrum TaxID=869889 RepID=A0A7D5P451_9EURY|nr:hypothetical protein [Halosimplex rubrum]QLH77082.1 hypothetical protein HZS55_07150 [Halosimplex rubrum]